MTKQNKESEKREVDYIEEGSKGLALKVGTFFNKITYPNGKIKFLPGIIGLQLAGALAFGVSSLVYHTVDYIKNNKNKSPIFETKSWQSPQYLQKDSIEFSHYTLGTFNYYQKKKK